MIRLILVLLVIALYFIVTLPLFLVLLLVGIRYPKARALVAQGSVVLGFRAVLLAAGVKVRVQGRENIPNEPALFAGNHRSYFDIPVIYTTIPCRLSFVAKIELRRVPFLSWWMRLLSTLFLDRGDLKQAMKMLLSGIDLLKSGTSICIMPEGTRCYADEMLPFKEGSFKMAEKTGCPIVPIAMWKNDDIYEAQHGKIKATTVTIRYGEPIRMSELSKEERKKTGALVRQRIEAMLTEIV